MPETTTRTPRRPSAAARRSPLVPEPSFGFPDYGTFSDTLGPYRRWYWSGDPQQPGPWGLLGGERVYEDREGPNGARRFWIKRAASAKAEFIPTQEALEVLPAADSRFDYVRALKTPPFAAGAHLIIEPGNPSFSWTLLASRLTPLSHELQPGTTDPLTAFLLDRSARRRKRAQLWRIIRRPTQLDADLSGIQAHGGA